jgi:hypothetical protein
LGCGNKKERVGWQWKEKEKKESWAGWAEKKKERRKDFPFSKLIQTHSN